MHPQLSEILAAEGLLVRRDLPHLVAPLDHALERGDLTAILPGIYAPRTAEPIPWRLHALAACRYCDDVVVTGAAAAALSFMPDTRVQQVAAFHAHAVRAAGLIGWHQQPIPPQWVSSIGPLRITHPAWTAVDLCGGGEGEALDSALREGVRLQTLWQAFADMPCRRGNQTRRRLLKDSRDEPWSPAERLAHQVLREAGITGWRTNVKLGSYFADIVWSKERVILEVDGYQFHGARASFEADRLRDQILVSQGWVVIRVTWEQLVSDRKQFVRRLRGTLRGRQARVAA